MLSATKWILCLVLICFYGTTAVCLRGENAVISEKDTLISNNDTEEASTAYEKVDDFLISSAEREKMGKSVPRTGVSFSEVEDLNPRALILQTEGSSDLIKNEESPVVDKSQHLETRDGPFIPDFSSWGQSPSRSPGFLPLGQGNDQYSDQLPPSSDEETRVEYIKDPDGRVYSVNEYGEEVPAPDDVVDMLKNKPPGRATIKTTRKQTRVPAGTSWTTQQEQSPPGDDPFESWFRNSEFSKPPGQPSNYPDSPPGSPARSPRSPPGPLRNPLEPLLRDPPGSPLRSPPGSPLRSPPGSPLRNSPGSPLRDPPGSPLRSPPASPPRNSLPPFNLQPTSPARFTSSPPKTSNSPMKTSGTPLQYEASYSMKEGSSSPPKGGGFTEEYEEEGEDGGGGEEEEDDEEPPSSSASSGKKSGTTKSGGKQSGGKSWSKSSSSSWSSSSRKKSGSGSSTGKGSKPTLIAIKRVKTMRVGNRWARKARSGRRSASVAKSARRGRARSRAAAASASASASAHGSARRRGRARSRGKG